MKYSEKMTNYYDFLLERKAYWHNKKIQSLNYGYWEKETEDEAEANRNLMQRLLEMVPVKSGKVLEVACGVGHTTHNLSQYFNPGEITAINISPTQIERAKEHAPGVTFLTMDATELAFEDSSFDLIVCVEAAFHFDTREKFVNEAFRVLKPGGYLVMSDIFFKSLTMLDKELFPPANIIKNETEYKVIYEKSGFADIRVKDVTGQTFIPFRSKMMQFYWRGLSGILHHPIDWLISLLATTYAIFSRSINLEEYVLVAAEKPLDKG